MKHHRPFFIAFLLSLLWLGFPSQAEAGPLKTHRIFSSNMVLQRDKPIVIWGWADVGKNVSVQLGDQKAATTAAGPQGRWEVTFPASPANATGQKLVVTAKDETLTLENIVIGDVWGMNGQSNMAFGLANVNESDMEIAQADLPLLRHFRISPNESYELLTDLPESAVKGWTVCTVSEPSYIREAQRLGVADVGDPVRTVFIPDYDVRIPGLHPKKKVTHGFRAARWALSTVYGLGKAVRWDSGKLLSAKAESEVMVLTFDKKVMPDDRSRPLEGFSIADASRKFYMAHAVYPTAGTKISDYTKVLVWSPLVKEPVAVRYAWSTRGPMGNLKFEGHEWLPVPSFRTDSWDWPESEDPTEQLVDRAKRRAMTADAEERLEFRLSEEAKRAVEIRARLKTLGKTDE